MTVTTGDILKLMETLADPSLAEDWDNSGLQAGHLEWPVRNVRIALDPLPEVVSSAVEQNIDLLITHHPLIFRPLSRIDFETPAGAIIRNAAIHRMSIYSAHTSLDIAEDGLNDILSSKIGLTDCMVLSEPDGNEMFKLVLFAPEGHEESILRAIEESGAGRIGKYAACSFRSLGTGSFTPDAHSVPFSGAIGEVNHVKEYRIETLVTQKGLSSVIRHVRNRHPYEEMAYDVYPLRMMERRSGLGRVGNLQQTITLEAFAGHIAKTLDLSRMNVVGDPGLLVEKVAVCSGSGGSLLSAFLKSGAQVFITGDMRYHDAMAVKTSGLGLIDIGHFESEHIVVKPIADRLRDMAAEKGYDITVDVCSLERSPFW